MNGHVLVAVMTVACTAAAGPYEVRLAQPAGEDAGSKGSRLWGSVRVAAADEAERAECARRVAGRAPESREERWPEGTSWPASPWDVRSVRAGGELRARDGLAMGNDGGVELASPGFTRPVVMHGDKMVAATVRIRCDARPGLYVVHWNERGRPVKVWARYRVTAAAPGCQDPVATPRPAAARRAAPWLLGGATALAAAAGYAIRRRRGNTTLRPW
ncbi:hypothetical protein [Streptomyces avidinii]